MDTFSNVHAIFHSLGFSRQFAITGSCEKLLCNLKLFLYYTLIVTLREEKYRCASSRVIKSSYSAHRRDKLNSRNTTRRDGRVIISSEMTSRQLFAFAVIASRHKTQDIAIGLIGPKVTYIQPRIFHKTTHTWNYSISAESFDVTRQTVGCFFKVPLLLVLFSFILFRLCVCHVPLLPQLRFSFYLEEYLWPRHSDERMLHEGETRIFHENVPIME